MRLLAIPVERMRMLMVRIVAMRMQMLQHLVLVLVGMMFRYVQPHAQRHETRGNGKRPSDRFLLQGHR
jgi:hypothetical protein